MKIGFVDFKHEIDGFANRDQTGGFGSQMQASGVIGKLLQRVKKTNSRLPVLSLAYLAAIARDKNHETLYFDTIPDCDLDILIVATSMAHYKHEITFCENVRKKFERTKIGLIGPFSSEMPNLFIDYVDFIITGEPEDAFMRICEGLIAAEGIIESVQIDDVNTLPFPDWSIFPVESYGYFPSLPKKPFLTIQASRGCPFACEFCPYLVQQGIPLRRRANHLIVEEIEKLVRDFGIKSLLFRDITWSMHRKETKELCRLLIEKDFSIEIGVETRADTLDDELIGLMEQANIKVVNLGIESPSDEILINSGRRPIKELKLERVLRKLDESSIDVQAFYILGLIDDTIDSMKRTISYSFSLNTLAAQYCVLTPFPGTKTYEDLKEHLITDDFSMYNEYEPVVSIEHASPKEIRKLRNFAFSRYYIRPRWLIKYGVRVFAKLMFPNGIFK